MGAVLGDGVSVTHREDSAATPRPTEKKDLGRRHLEHQWRPHRRGDQDLDGQTGHDIFPGSALPRRRGVDLRRRLHVHTHQDEAERQGCIVAIRRDNRTGRTMIIDRCEDTRRDHADGRRADLQVRAIVHPPEGQELEQRPRRRGSGIRRRLRHRGRDSVEHDQHAQEVRRAAPFPRRLDLEERHLGHKGVMDARALAAVSGLGRGRAKIGGPDGACGRVRPTCSTTYFFVERKGLSVG